MFSVIITVYNKGEYILKTLESVIKNNTENVEVIIINDGSEDNCGELIQEFVNYNSSVNIKFVNRKENRGVTYSKYEGVKCARNEFVFFLDGDDIISENLFEAIKNEEINSSTVLEWSIFEFNNENDISKKNEDNNESITVERRIKSFFEDDMNSSMSNKLYYRTTLYKIFKRVPDISFAEDLIINMEYYLHVKRIIPLQNGTLFYRKAITSLTSKFDTNNYIKKAYDPYTYRKEFIRNYDLSRELLVLAQRWYLKMTFYTLVEIIRFIDDEDQALINENLKFIFNDLKSISFINLRLKMHAFMLRGICNSRICVMFIRKYFERKINEN